jgi:uncharacterized SAM-binding protein YcdF (DUF218 family)
LLRLVSAGVLAVVACSVFALPRAARWLVIVRPVSHCDLMVVPGGGARERLSTAAWLMSGGACDAVLFTGNIPTEARRGVYSFLAEIDAESLVEPPWRSRSTFEDAVVTLEVARQIGARSILLVTSPYHTRRAHWLFSRLLTGTGIRLGVYPSAAFYMDYEHWWSNRHGRDAVLGEYAKLWLNGLIAFAVVAQASAAATSD